VHPLSHAAQSVYVPGAPYGCGGNADEVGCAASRGRRRDGGHGHNGASAAEVHVYLDYAAWAKQPEDIRAAYIAGVFDSLVLITVDAETARAGKFFLGCIGNAKLDSVQLSEQLRAYARPRLELQAGTVQGALLRYLVSLCGRPPAGHVISRRKIARRSTRRMLQRYSNTT
jgi:hypothetical protein